MSGMRPTMTFQKYDVVPEWARFLSLDELRAFLDAVERDLLSRHLLFQERDGVLVVASPDGSLAQCGLAPLALACGAAGREAYAREIARHFGRLFGEPVELPPFPERFDEVRSAVQVRVYREEDLARRDVALVSRPLAAGLRAVAVYDLPNAVMSVAPSHLERWGVSPDEAFQIGISNVGRQKISRDAARIGRVELFYLMDEDGFAASQVFHLQTYFGSELGALVAMPTRHLLICCPIRTATILEALGHVTGLAQDIHEERAAEPAEGHLLVPDVYWWKDGRLSHLSVSAEGVGVPGASFAPTQEFIDEVLSRAAPLGPRTRKH